MSTANGDALEVYRLKPSNTGGQLMAFGGEIVPLTRWQFRGSEGEPPTTLTATWLAEPGQRKSEFPSGFTGAPVLGPRLVKALGAELLTAGRLLPLPIDGTDEEGYCLYVVEQVVDCLDTERSSKPQPPFGEITRAVFDTDRLPVDAAAFRMPQSATAVHWNGWMARRLAELLGDALEARLVWSEDPAKTPHPNPWKLS